MMLMIDAPTKEVLVSWSGGKDSCLALYELQQSAEYKIAALLTTITADYDRISMHGVRRELLEAQAASLGIPLHPVLISKGAANEEYETKLIEACSQYRASQDRSHAENGGAQDFASRANENQSLIDTIVFGDLFLADIRSYRDQFLARHNLRGLYPVWLRDTTEFIKEFIALGFKAIVTCTDAKILGSDFAGRVIDEEFLSALPPQVDPCGENGEFHTFVFDGPNFKQQIAFSKGEVVQRDGFWFCDLLSD
jgi:uncharacterized protein (TIGR00290 family)